jgi:hypothetical protein
MRAKLSKKDYNKLVKVSKLIQSANELFQEVYDSNYKEMVNHLNIVSIDNKLRWVADAIKTDIQEIQTK